MKYSRFQVYVDDDLRWRWRLIAANGVVMAVSADGYRYLSAARLAAERSWWSWRNARTIVEVEGVSHAR